MYGDLAQSAPLLAEAKNFASQIYFWLAVILALAFVLGFIALWLRKKLLRPYDDISPMGFTLKDLRAMHAEGQLSDEELAQAEAKALARTRSHYLGVDAKTEDEVEDLGHLSTDSEEDSVPGTENEDDSSDKNGEDEAKP